ncbi:MAG: hypothetical protein DRO08_00960 [Thermoprotei archaeon]|nr:MAG: hypothetical protein DRO08_00960 [Thermoprotei archaeon]
MKLLVSIWYPEELFDAVEGGADIVDVKDPSSGSLGAPKPEVLRNIVNIINSKNIKCELSAAVGDVKCCPSTVRLAAYFLASMKLNYIKVGIEANDVETAYNIARSVVEGAKEVGSSKVILVGYADFRRVKSISPLNLPEIAYKAEADGVMIDTRIKNGANTFNYLTLSYLKKFVIRAKERSLLTALAGGIRGEHIKIAYGLGFDVVGVRTAACHGGRLGKVSRSKVEKLKEIISSCME